MSEHENHSAVVPVNLEDEYKTSYLRYSMSVIISRALPDVRDGLKPSQRRILYAMRQLNLSPGAKHRKCAKVCGDTSGDYHPHGEGVIYPTLARMAQPWSMRYRLVDGQGNFGSVDGDPPAAMRYTEARLTQSAMDMLQDLDKNTVDMVPNYDETRLEPVVLPSRFPNLLSNGSSGIAVGMATNIPPHNVKELIDATVLCIENPTTTVDEIMKVMPGPDFPTGGVICGKSGIVSAYHTGRGRIILRAKIDVKDSSTKSGRQILEITEIPYGVNKSELISKIADLVNDKKINGISDIIDLSDKNGMCITVELKKDEIPDVIINQLLKHTALQVTFGANMLALVNGLPRTLNIKQMITHWINHRIEVIRRRTRFELDKAEARAHILEGYLKALDHLDEVIKIIRASNTRDEAKVKLIDQFTFSDRQADAVLSLRLYQLTGLERDGIESEYAELQAKIEYYKKVLADVKEVHKIIVDELKVIRDHKAHKSGRQTQFMAAEGEFSMEDLLANEREIITISGEDYIKRMPIATFREQRRGGTGVIGLETKSDDELKGIYSVKTHDTLLIFTNFGRVYPVKAWDIPKADRRAKGRPLLNFIQGYDPSGGERVATILPISNFDMAETYILLATRKGVVKKTSIDQFAKVRQTGIYAINIDEGDEVINAQPVQEGDQVMLFTCHGMAIRFGQEEIRPMGRQTRGVTGAKFKSADDYIVSCEVVKDEQAAVLVVSSLGKGKRSKVIDFRKTSRGAKGVIAMKTSRQNGDVVGARIVNANDRIIIMSTKGQTVLMSLDDIRVMGRATSGVKLVNLSSGDEICAHQKIEVEDDPKEEETSKDEK